jgi:hypothetical protein
MDKLELDKKSREIAKKLDMTDISSKEGLDELHSLLEEAEVVRKQFCELYNINYEKAVKWLRGQKVCAYTQEEQDIISYIEEMLDQYEDLRNS